MGGARPDPPFYSARGLSDTPSPRRRRPTIRCPAAPWRPTGTLDVGSLVSLDKRGRTWHKDKNGAAASLEEIHCANKSKWNKLYTHMLIG